ncbi:MAG: nucleotidyl transferase AbiEii/AbiGii toxin family protein [Proteobacteria bacterium]|nr:nucleotidyl transferase AbiEii/AbiGii toxin family protein [Pseudomonadota bacterium]
MKDNSNISVSIHQRLLNKARTENRSFNELAQYFAIERFLYRLSKSTHSDRFILKGAMMLRAWQSPEIRPTKDIDLLGKTNNDEFAIINQIKAIIVTEVEPDGLNFDLNSIKADRITEDADYEGIHIHLNSYLGNMRIGIHIDIGSGDIVYPEPDLIEIPVILDLPIPNLYGYSRESTIAEKFNAMVELGELNSQMKDFYDIWLLSRQFEFDKRTLADAIRITFNTRNTQIPNKVDAFTDRFIELKQTQWTAFHKRLKNDQIPEDFRSIVNEIQAFLSPVIMFIK